MTTSLTQAGVRAPSAARAALVERRLSRFRADVRPRVRALAAQHVWIGDLAVSFPGLLFALARPRGGFDVAPAVRLAAAGAPLATIAARAGAPLWLRGFPPEAFETALPALPDGAGFRLRIANHFPTNWALAPRWIDGVGEAARWGDEEIALWFARERPLTRLSPMHGGGRRWRPPDHRRLVLLWAWFSKAANTGSHTGAHDFIETTWLPAMQWRAAADFARAWREAMALALYVPREIEDVWLEAGVVDGFSFTPLRSHAAITEEGREMKNCVRSYGGSVADNTHRLWSVRRNDERVATLCVAAGFPEGPLPTIVELAGPGNAPAAPAVWRAARRWLHAHDDRPFDAARLARRFVMFDDRLWRALWRPYWLAKRRIPAWLPLTANEMTLHAL